MSVHLHRCPIEGCRTILVDDPSMTADRREEPATEALRELIRVSKAAGMNASSDFGYLPSQQHADDEEISEAVQSVYAAFANEREARALPAPLDVELLAKAVGDHCHDSVDEGLPILLRHTHLAPFMTGDCGDAIAREYQSLSNQPSTEPTQGGTE